MSGAGCTRGQNEFAADLAATAQRIVARIDFNETLMQGMLSYLLFAGSLHINLESLSQRKWTIGTLATFSELVDEILNAVLFVLIGLEILVVTLKGGYLLAGAVAIPVVLLARLVSVGVPVMLLKLRTQFSPHVVKLLTWGGLRGGISVALVLSLPLGPARDVLLTVTYCVVVFSIAVQGLTLPLLLRKTHPAPSASGG